MNEPWCASWLGYAKGEHAPGRRDVGLAAAATHHLLLAHGGAVQAIRAAVPGARVGIGLNLQPMRAASDHEDDVAAARLADGNLNRLFLEPVLRGRVPGRHAGALRRPAGPGFSVVEDGDLGVIAQPLDFLGVNFYAPHDRLRGRRMAEARAAGYWVPAPRRTTCSAPTWGRRGAPPRPPTHRDGLGDRAGRRSPSCSSGCATNTGPCPSTCRERVACDDYVGPDGQVHDAERIAYLEGHLRAVLDAVDAGVDIRGYFVWSLLDNFEWAKVSPSASASPGSTTRAGPAPQDELPLVPRTVRANALTPVTASSALVVVNPVSAGGQTMRRWPAIRGAARGRNRDDAHLTVGPGDATTVTREEILPGVRRVVAVGGDGTLNEAVNGCFDDGGAPLAPGLTVGLIPSGTGSDFRRTLGLPTDPGAAARLLAGGTTRTIDLGRIDFPDGTVRLFVNIADCGIGGEVASRVNRRRRRRAAAWPGRPSSSGCRWRADHVPRPRRDAHHRRGDLRRKVQQVVVANGSYFGGGMHIAPGAEPADGLLDVVIVADISRARSPPRRAPALPGHPPGPCRGGGPPGAVDRHRRRSVSRRRSSTSTGSRWGARPPRSPSAPARCFAAP